MQIYLDYNATTPIDNSVLEAMLPYLTTNFGNAASRAHAFGWIASEAVELAREQVAALIRASAEEIIFTSGATEGCNLALKGIFEQYKTKGNHIITTATEHPAVLDTCKHIEQLGGEVTYLPVNEAGLINLNDLENTIKPATILISAMYANNETGVINPINLIGQIARKHRVLFFTDATQAVGKIPIDVEKDGIDILTLSAHKIYGPKGVGAVYKRRKNPRVTFIPQIDGGGHERGFRSGTLNVPGIAGLGKACAIAAAEMTNHEKNIRLLRDKLENELLQIPHTHLNGSKEKRLYNTANISFDNVNANLLIAAINKNIAVSSGSACASATLQPSHVLMAMNKNERRAKTAIRFSLGKYTTLQEIDYTIEKITLAVERLRALNIE
ncbi:MAG: IscS subfamily cysteine desulfurase [Chitinophagaceae bacterium]|nr:IscS subfamily cysteine desulfurase [Chitinophagaceae bacterium]